MNNRIKTTGERKEKFRTTSDYEVRELYTPIDLDGWDYPSKLESPGEYPFTRGVYPSMYRGRIWTFREYAGFGTAEEANQRFRYLLDNGQKGLSSAQDLPTQMGYDSDHPRVIGEVGRLGVALSSVVDMETLYQGIPLNEVTVSYTINATAAIILAMHLVAAERQGVKWTDCGGTIQNDILKEYVARGTYIYPPRGAMRLITDIFSFCTQEVPKWNTISVSGYHMREAGSTAAQELGFTLAHGIAYVNAALQVGLEIDKFAPRLSFFFTVHNNFFEEIAKLRAARRLWARIMKDRFDAKDPRSMMLRMQVNTGGSTLTAQQPDNNVVRVTLQALMCVLGGVQSLHTCSKDEALALPTEEAVQLALRTQQIIAYESGVADTVDPLGGSYFIESLTDTIERQAEEYINRIDQLGGAIKAIEAGYQQREIAEAAYRYQRAVEAKEIVIVGVNEFKKEEDSSLATLKIDPTIETKQKARLAKVRSERSQAEAMRLVAEVEKAAKEEKNLMPYIVAAVRAHATLGEISDALRKVFGEYQPKTVL